MVKMINNGRYAQIMLHYAFTPKLPYRYYIL
jgi:hypothetical protein